MGCGGSQPAAAAASNADPPLPPAKKTATGTSVAIIYYSMYGHIRKMAEEVKKGLEAGGVAVDIFQVPETLHKDVLAAMHAPPKPSDIQTIDHAFLAKLPEYDGFVFGFPTRFGMMAGQMKSFFDSTGQLWQAGKLAGKPVTAFVSTGTQGGGQETTHLTAITQFVHHGMIYVPLGYQSPAEQFDLSEIHGGSAYGAGMYAGPDGSRQASAKELAICVTQGKTFAAAVKRNVGTPTQKKPKVAVVYYSMYGHIKKLADEIAGAARAQGVDVDLFQVPELLPDAVLQAMHAPPKCGDPVLDHSKLDSLVNYDGFIFGLPTRFGGVPAQMKSFFDSTGGLWQSGKLTGKLAATFVCTSSQNGGQESTHLNAISNFAHHGMIYVPLGAQAGADGQFDMTEVHGGSPWGAGSLSAGDGSRQASAIELKIAAKQGEVFAKRIKQMALP